MRSLRVSLIVLIAGVATEATAQEAPPVLLPPPPSSPELVPPAPLYALPPGLPTPEQIEALESSGHESLVTGNALLATGAAMVAVGVGMLIAGDTFSDGDCGQGWHQGAGHRYWSSGSCGPSSLSSFGSATIFLGVAAMIPGGASREAGLHDLARAESMRQRLCRYWSLRPKVSRDGASAELALKF